jgi:hypothetical protein
MAAPIEGHIEGYFIPTVTKRSKKKNWPLPPFVVEEGKRIEAQVSAQKLADNKGVILSKLSGDNWFEIPEVKVIDASVTGDLVTSGHSVSNDLKVAFQPVISDIFHEKVMKTVTSDNGHGEESDKVEDIVIHSESLGDSDAESFTLESDGDKIYEAVSDSDKVTGTASSEVADLQVNFTVSDKNADSYTGVFFGPVIERAPVEFSDSDKVSTTPRDRSTINNGRNKLSDIFTVSDLSDKSGEGRVTEYYVSSDNDNRIVSERVPVTGGGAVYAGAPVTNYVAPSVNVPVHVVVSDGA